MESQAPAQNDFKWYIIKTKTNCEFKAKEAIYRLAKDHKMDRRLKEILIPEKRSGGGG